MSVGVPQETDGIIQTLNGQRSRSKQSVSLGDSAETLAASYTRQQLRAASISCAWEGGEVTGAQGNGSLRGPASQRLWLGEEE